MNLRDLEARLERLRVTHDEARAEENERTRRKREQLAPLVGRVGCVRVVSLQHRDARGTLREIRRTQGLVSFGPHKYLYHLNIIHPADAPVAAEARP
jgi:hypothetical protein